MSTNENTSVRTVVNVSIDAPVHEVFRLTGPLEEYWWIPGWKCRMIHCPNDRVEQGTEFDEFSSSPFLGGFPGGRTRWTAVLRDEENHVVHYRLDNCCSTSMYRMTFQDDGKGGTVGTLDFTYTPTTAWGRRNARRNLDAKIELMISVIAAMLKHFCENGELIASSEIEKMVRADRSLAVTDKVHLGLNRLSMKRRVDPDRARFLAAYPTAGSNL